MSCNKKLFRGGGQQVKVNSAWNGPEWFVIHQERAGDKSKKLLELLECPILLSFPRDQKYGSLLLMLKMGMQ